MKIDLGLLTKLQVREPLMADRLKHVSEGRVQPTMLILTPGVAAIQVPMSIEQIRNHRKFGLAVGE